MRQGYKVFKQQYTLCSKIIILHESSEIKHPILCDYYYKNIKNNTHIAMLNNTAKSVKKTINVLNLRILQVKKQGRIKKIGIFAENFATCAYVLYRCNRQQNHNEKIASKQLKS